MDCCTLLNLSIHFHWTTDILGAILLEPLFHQEKVNLDSVSETSPFLTATASTAGFAEAPAHVRKVHGRGSLCGTIQPQIPGGG